MHQNPRQLHALMRVRFSQSAYRDRKTYASIALRKYNARHNIMSAQIEQKDNLIQTITYSIYIC
jgi:hypothetical protein